MKNQKLLIAVFIIIGLFVLTVGSSVASAATYSYDFNVFGKTYTVSVDTNSDVSNVTWSQSGLGVQFQVSVPIGTPGFFNVTVPASLLGSHITVFQDGVLLAENVSYTQVQNGTDFLFHLEYASGNHTIVMETSQMNTPIPNQSGVPIETIVVVGAVAAAAAIGAGIVIAFKGAIFHKAGTLAGKGAIKAVGTPHGGGGGGSGGAGAGGGVPAHVPVGANIIVHPHPAIGLTFSQVQIAGAATATPLLSFPALPEGLKFLGTVFDIKTTAVFAGAVLVALAFDGKDMTEEQKKKLRVYRNDLKKDSVWEDVTSSIDTKNNIAYGSTDHFSGFGIH
jgi:hypothetical protein